MNTALSRSAEDFVASFLPPACREEVLGDLWESCKSPADYLASALSVIPRVIFSQIRRNTNSWVFLLTSCAIVFSFIAGSAGFSPDLAHPLLRLAIPIIPALLSLLICNGFAPIEERRLHAITFDIVIAMSVAAITQLILLATLQKSLMVPGWWPSEGNALSWLSILVLRAIFPPGAKLTLTGMKYAFIAMLFLLSLTKLRAESQAPAFEAASIREAPPLSFEHAQSGQIHVGTKINGDHADYGYMSLADLIAYAYRVKRYQLSGPAWLNETHWDISTKLPAAQPLDHTPEMMQNLLAERFKLTIQRESRQQPVYALVVGKGSLKIQKATAQDDVTQGNGAVVSGGTTGTVRVSPGPNGLRLQMANITMASFSGLLTQFVDRPVIDATQLNGEYQVTLDLPADLMNGMPAAQKLTAILGLGSSGMVPDTWDAAIFQAVKTLGLELKSRKDSVETIVVDHAEKTPTAN